MPALQAGRVRGLGSSSSWPLFRSSSTAPSRSALSLIGAPQLRAPRCSAPQPREVHITRTVLRCRVPSDFSSCSSFKSLSLRDFFFIEGSEPLILWKSDHRRAGWAGLMVPVWGPSPFHPPCTAASSKLNHEAQTLNTPSTPKAINAFAPPSSVFTNVQCVRETEILVEQQSPQEVFVCDHAGLVINKFSLEQDLVLDPEPQILNAPSTPKPLHTFEQDLLDCRRGPHDASRDSVERQRRGGTRAVAIDSSSAI